MTDYPTTDDIRERLPYSAGALGFDDDIAYEAVLDDIRTEEIDRIEAWGHVIGSVARAERLTDGSDPRTAFEVFEGVENTIDGSRATHGARLVDDKITKARGDRYFEQKKRRTDDEDRRRRVLPVPGRPIESVETVELTRRDIELSVGEDVFVVRDSALELAESAPIAEWPRKRRSVRIVYSFGNDGVPGRVASALVDLVHLRLVNDESLVVDSESIDGDSVNYRDRDEIMKSAFAAVAAETDDSASGGVMSI